MIGKNINPKKRLNRNLNKIEKVEGHWVRLTFLKRLRRFKDLKLEFKYLNLRFRNDFINI